MAQADIAACNDLFRFRGEQSQKLNFTLRAIKRIARVTVVARVNHEFPEAFRDIFKKMSEPGLVESIE